MSKPLQIFTPREAHILVAASMFIALFIGLTFQGLIDGLDEQQPWENLAVLLSELLIVVPAAFILRQRGIAVLDVLPRKSSSPMTYLMTGLLILGLVGVISIYEILVVPYFPMPDFLEQLQLEMADLSTLDMVILMVAAVLVAPLVEESLFRGVLQHSLFYHFGSLIPAIVIPSLIFTLFHLAYLFYFPALLELILLAFILAWLMAKTGNILVPMLAHALFNLSTFLDVFTTDLEQMETPLDLGLTWIIGSVFLCFLAGFYFRSLKAATHEEVYLIPPAYVPGPPNV